MSRKHNRASLAKQTKQTPDKGLQAGPRSTNSIELNYRSVNTLDPSRLASAFMMADQGMITHQAALFELIEEQDSHIFSELGKRRRSVTGLGWSLEPPKDASQAELDRTIELEDMLRSIPRIEDAQYDITDAVGKGFTALEYNWQRGDVWLPKDIFFVPQRHFQIERATGEIKYLANGIPESLRPNGWIVHEHRAKSGYIEQSALFRVLAWTYAYKAYDVRDMQRFLEVYGLPLRLGKYPAGIGKTQRDELLRAVRNIGNDGAGVVPSNMQIDFMQATARGTVTDFLSAIEYWENKQSKAILGGELDGKTTSEARIMIYDKVRREILLHDVRQIEPTLNTQLIKPISAFNGMFTDGRLPKWAYQTEETVDQKNMVDVLDKAVSLGMEIDVEYAHEILQIPRADETAKKLGKVQPTSPPVDNKNDGAAGDNKQNLTVDNMLNRLAALASQKAENADITDAYTAQLAALGAKHEAALVQQIAAVVAEAGDFDAALEGIEALAVSFNVPALTEVIALGMAAAHLAGRAEVPGE
jgi:phage gp29-like protein